MRDLLKAQYYQTREAENYVISVMPELPYHNYFNHVTEVRSVAKALATAYMLPVRQRFQLDMGMLFHDVQQAVGAKNNEELSAKDAARLLTLMGVPDEDINEVVSVVLATKPQAKPQTVLEMIAKDADMHNLGTPYFMQANERVRAEFAPMSDSAWYASTLRNIGDFEFHTLPGQMLYSTTWRNNREMLRQLVEKNNAQMLSELK